MNITEANAIAKAKYGPTAVVTEQDPGKCITVNEKLAPQILEHKATFKFYTLKINGEMVRGSTKSFEEVLEYKK
jgi:hypothetical protein